MQAGGILPGRLLAWQRSRSRAARRRRSASIQALIADCARAALERDGITILSYGTGGGYGPLREVLAERHGVEAGSRLPHDRRPAGVRLLRGRPARAAAGPRARRGADLRPAAEDPGARRGGGRAARDGRRGPRPRRARGRAPAGRCRSRSSTRSRRSRTRPAARSGPSAASGSSSSPPSTTCPILEDDPYGRVRYDGEPLPVDPRARGRRARHVHLVVLEDGGARPPDRVLRRAAGARRAPTTTAPSRPTSRRACCRRRPCTSSCTAAPSSRTSIACAACSRGARTRCSLRSRPRCRRGRAGAHREGGYFLWLDFAGRRRLRAHLLTRATEAGVTFVRGIGLLPERVGRPVVGAPRLQLRDARADRRGRRAARLAAVGETRAKAAGRLVLAEAARG